MSEYKFDDVPDGDLYANIVTCRFDSIPCPFDDADDRTCVLCLRNLIGVYQRHLKSLEDKLNGPAA